MMAMTATRERKSKVRAPIRLTDGSSGSAGEWCVDAVIGWRSPPSKTRHQTEQHEEEEGAYQDHAHGDLAVPQRARLQRYGTRPDHECQQSDEQAQDLHDLQQSVRDHLLGRLDARPQLVGCRSDLFRHLGRKVFVDPLAESSYVALDVRRGDDELSFADEILVYGVVADVEQADRP